MLKQLHVKNFALIEDAAIHLSNGFTVITGETGSGKSILLGALKLVLGERADYSVIRDKDKKTVVEAVIELQDEQWQIFFDENDLDFLQETIVRREIQSTGKSRSFINDTPVSLALLKQLGDRVLHIHSQHHTINLRDRSFQLELLDIISGAHLKVKDYQLLFEEHKKLSKAIDELKTRISENRKSKDFNLFQIEELSRLELDKINYKDLSEQYNRITQQEEIQFALNQIVKSIDLENGLYDNLMSLVRAIKVNDKKVLELTERINAAAIEVSDIALCANDELQRMEEASEEHLLTLREKLDFFNAMLFKHNALSQEELVAIYVGFQSSIQEDENLEEELKQVEKKSASILLELQELANIISQTRKQAVGKTQELLIQTLATLKMKDALVQFEFEHLEDLNKTGMDAVRLLFTSNKGVAPQPVDKSASGGELSRLMLSIQYVLSGLVKLPTVIFDEIDTGVSGEVAQKIGQLLKSMGANMQIIAITHLPQVASQGRQHIKVVKEVLDAKSYSAFKILDYAGRVDEIAQMMSGEVINEAARQTAAKLLEEDEYRT
ncbi:MAG: DNA repair protein RecN [Crocinitomicaceae bacterium]|nr:DNA repair protein RecN [Crocinitomicaceae bacterium]